MSSALPNPPSLVEYGSLRFLIFDAPNDANLHLYLQEFQRHNVTSLVRVCDPTYATTPVEELGIKVYDWPFADGASPPDSVISKWRTLIREYAAKDEGKEAIGIHCVAGLGRAPVLVAIALIEEGSDPIDAVELIRSKRRGCINRTQLAFLSGYRKKQHSCLVS